MTQGSPQFVTTCWSVVLAAQGGRKGNARVALETLCRTYWYPLYAYARRRGQGPEDARDAVQGFFTRLIERETLCVADRERGRFRAFLLTAFKNDQANTRKREAALKRGGGRVLLSLDVDEPELRFAREPAHEITPEALYLRSWAVSTLEVVFRRLRTLYEERDQGALFEAAKTYIGADGRRSPSAELAAELGMKEGAFRVAVHRLRQRFRQILLEEVTGTLGDADPEAEIRELLLAFKGT